MNPSAWRSPSVCIEPLLTTVSVLPGSENDPLEAFKEEQLFIVFVMQHGGLDLESYQLRGYEEAQSILMQVCCPCCTQCKGIEGLDNPVAGSMSRCRLPTCIRYVDAGGHPDTLPLLHAACWTISRQPLGGQ